MLSEVIEQHCSHSINIFADLVHQYNTELYIDNNFYLAKEVKKKSNKMTINPLNSHQKQKTNKQK